MSDTAKYAIKVRRHYCAWTLDRCEWTLGRCEISWLRDSVGEIIIFNSMAEAEVTLRAMAACCRQAEHGEYALPTYKAQRLMPVTLKDGGHAEG